MRVCEPTARVTVMFFKYVDNLIITALNKTFGSRLKVGWNSGG